MAKPPFGRSRRTTNGLPGSSNPISRSHAVDGILVRNALLSTLRGTTIHPYVSSFLACGTIPSLVVVGYSTEEVRTTIYSNGRLHVESTTEMLEDVEEDLMARSFLFANPVSYRDGVGAATQAFRAMLAKVPPNENEVPPVKGNP